MQVISENEDERSYSRETNTVDFVIYTGRDSRCMEKNMLEDLEAEGVKYESVGEFLVAIRREFREGDEEVVKVAELKKIEQGGRMMEEFV